MGWFATVQALKYGQGAYGTVKQSLRGECDPPRTLSVAIQQISAEILSGQYVPDKKARARLLYWARRVGLQVPTYALTVGAKAERPPKGEYKMSTNAFCPIITDEGDWGSSLLKDGDYISVDDNGDVIIHYGFSFPWPKEKERVAKRLPPPLEKKLVGETAAFVMAARGKGIYAAKCGGPYQPWMFTYTRKKMPDYSPVGLWHASRAVKPELVYIPVKRGT